MKKKSKAPTSRRPATKSFGRPRGKHTNKRTADPPEVPSLFAAGSGLHQAGRLAEAEKAYHQILAIQPDHFESLHLLGLISHQRGNHAEAVRQIDIALKSNPDDIFALNNRGIALKELKRYEEALASYDRALGQEPNQVEVLSNRGIALHELKQFEEALASYDRALALRPDHPEVLSNRGITLHELKRFEEALASYDRALTLRPDYIEAQSNRGNALRDLNRLEEALASYDRALALRPDHAEVLSNRGLALHGLMRFEEALAHHDRALAQRPDYAEALRNRGMTLNELKRFEEALASYDRALALRPDYVEALVNRGQTLYELKQFQEALASYDSALALNRELAEAYNGIGNVLKVLGKLQEAEKAFLEALRLDANIAGVYCNLADLKTFSSDDPHLAAMELLAERKGISQMDRIQLDFALGKAYADLKDYGRSFKHLLAGNVGKRATINYDETATLALFQRIEAVFNRGLIASKSGSGDSSPMPIFIVGMPRSGTTLVEQIIASHPMVHGAGELQTLGQVIPTAKGRDGNVIPFPEFAPALDVSALKEIGARYVAAVRDLIPKGKAAQAERVTDKMPSNYNLIGLIHLALPNARIIHTARDPVDTCISCFSKLFSGEQNHTYNLAEVGRYYKRYDQLMKHWRHVLPQGRILDVRYEDVVADLEGQARRIVSYCGLPWDDRCLSFHKTDRPVQTASVTQVRQPIYSSAVGRWRLYEEHLGPLVNALGIVTSVVRIDAGDYLIRTLTKDDASDRWAAWIADPEVAKMLNAPTRALTKEEIKKYINRFDQQTKLLLGIFDKRTNLHIGFFSVDIDYRRSQGRINMLIGDAKYRHRGVLSMIRSYYLKYLFETLGLKKLTATALAHNQIIINLLIKRGWKVDNILKEHMRSHADGSKLDVWVMSLSRDAWRARNMGGANS